MKNVLLIVSVLAVGCLTSQLFTHSWQRAGCFALSCVFIFTSIGHFVKGSEMQGMIPLWIPLRGLVVILSGLFEFGLAMALLFDRSSFTAGIISIAFLIAAFPLNIYSAVAHAEFGGHGAGPSYLFVRMPLQLLLIGWAYWFCIRPW